MEQTLPSTCRVRFEDPHQLHDFHLTVIPDEGFWAGGRFRFHIFVTEDYNMAVSKNLLQKIYYLL
jgi:ubiquitin-conjugating enzyme E2 F